jgi:biotin synthase
VRRPADSTQGDPGFLDRILEGSREKPGHADLVSLLSSPDRAPSLVRAADSVLRDFLGQEVFVRGLVEISNICGKNCFYCGLRRGNRFLERYRMTEEEIAYALESGYEMGLRSFLLQSGELPDSGLLGLVAGALRHVRSSWGESVRMVLSLGELPRNEIDRLRSAGGDRYLLRIETSDRDLYRALHPEDVNHSFDDRLACLRYLRQSGWQTGSGVLIGVPGQSEEILAKDLQFLRDEDVDMCGMGPWVEHDGTPTGASDSARPSRERRVELTLRMIALLRMLMPTINIAATTALQTLDPDGLRKGLEAGANVFMVNLTPPEYRKSYDLYKGKVALADRPETLLNAMYGVCESINRTLELRDPGDSLHYRMRDATPV